jgi:hypothetical protein
VQFIALSLDYWRTQEKGQRRNGHGIGPCVDIAMSRSRCGTLLSHESSIALTSMIIND